MFRADYTELASDYDAKRFVGTKGRFNDLADQMIIDELVGLTDSSIVFDVPVGTGRVADYLEQRGVQVIGCDLTEAMLRQAAARRGAAWSTLLCSDATRLPFADHAARCITCLRFFHLIPHSLRAAVAAELTRVLAPGGHLICSFTNGWYGGGINWAKKLLGRNGLHFLRPRELRALFPAFEVRAVRGNFWPLQRLTGAFGEAGARRSIHLNRLFPFNRICWEIFYLLQKPAA